MFEIDPKIFPQAQGIYIVGGSVRDRLNGNEPYDYDLCVTGDPAAFARRLAGNISGRLVELGCADQKIFRVVAENSVFDICAMQGRSIKDDLSRRDYTINAMAYDLLAGKLIDLQGGRRDLANRTIRMVSNHAFRDDPVRLIRAFRLGAMLNFSIEPATMAAIGENAGRIQRSAPERIRDEFLKMLGTTSSCDYLSQMAAAGLLFAILPELKKLRKCPPNTYHQYNAWGHTLQAFSHLESLLNSNGSAISGLHPQCFSDIDHNRATLLKCAILMHDIGKPAVRNPDHENDHYYGHEKKAVEMAQAICERLKFSNRQTNYVTFIIGNHNRPLFLFKAHQTGSLTPRALTRFFRNCTQRCPDLLLHAIADFAGKGEKNRARSQAFAEFAAELSRKFYNRFKPLADRPRLITGRDLITEFSLPPSALFKSILDHVEQERLAGMITSRQQALQLVKAFLKRPKADPR